MMKSFFKKLAFVMALAMVVTAAAPAAKAAVAAEDKALAIAYQNGSAVSEINLTEVGDEEDLRFLYAPANWKELGFKFTSSNENVVTVDPVTGVVKAVAAGSAIVSVAVGTETASVTVNCVDLPTYTVKISDPEGNLVTEYTLDEVGATVDFAFKGVKDYSRDDYTGTGVSRYFCQWDTTDETVAKVDQSGLVTAVAPGKAKITLIVWNLETGKKHDVEACWVTVAEPKVEEPEVVEQNIIPQFNKTQDVVEVVLGSGAGLTKDNVKVYRVFVADDDNDGDGYINEELIDKGYESVYVENVWFDTATGNWNVQTYDDFIDGATYEVVVPKYDPERFTASVGDVFTVEVYEDGTGAILPNYDLEAVPTKVNAILKDKNGVDVTYRVVNGVPNNDDSNLVYWLVDNTTDDYILYDYNKVMFYEMNTAQVIGTFDNNGTPVDSVPCLLTPSPATGYEVEKVVSWTLVKYVRDGSNNITGVEKFDWSKPLTKVPAGEYDYVIATLLVDSRGNYFTTCEYCATTNHADQIKYNGNNVYYTEDETEPFWIYGYEVEYEAMDPDIMGVEVYGDIATYKQDRARYALNLYNQFETAEKKFVKTLYSQFVEVCHPMKLSGINASNSVEVFMNTEGEAAENAYYSLWSISAITVNLRDIHDVAAKAEHAAEAQFKVELVSPAIKGEEDINNDNATDLDKDDDNYYLNLQTLVAKWEAELNNDGSLTHWDDSNKTADDDTVIDRKIVIEANDFVDTKIFAKRSQIKIKVTELTTGDSETITITLVRPELEVSMVDDGNGVLVPEKDLDGNYVYTGSAKVDTVNEYHDTKKIYVPFEKFVLSNRGDLEVKLHDYAPQTVVLLQPSTSGKYIGVENGLFVANTLDVETTADLVDGTTIAAGDRVVIIRDPNGKIYYTGLTDDYPNPNKAKYPKSSTNLGETFALPTKAVGFGAEVVPATKIDGKDVPAGGILPAVGAAWTPVQYKFTFAAIGADGQADDGKEVVYAATGRYTVTIKTVEEVSTTQNTDGSYNITFTQSKDLNKTFYINVKNENPTITVTKRAFTRVTSDEVREYNLYSNVISSYDWDGDDFDNSSKVTVNAGYGNDDDVKDLIMAAFDFSNGDLDAEDILYYTYTYTGSNKQVVINDVTFKVPAKGITGGWYRSTATVNKSLTFELQ